MRIHKFSLPCEGPFGNIPIDRSAVTVC